MKHIERIFGLKAWVGVRLVDIGGGAEAKIKLFSEYGHVANQIKADETGSNMVANILPADAPLTQRVGSKGQTIYFSESSHVAYQIKANDACSSMVANILPTDTPSTQGVESKDQTISFCPPPFRRKAEGHSFRHSVLPSFRPSVRPSVLPSFRPPNIVGTLCAQLLLQFYADSFETLQMF